MTMTALAAPAASFAILPAERRAHMRWHGDPHVVLVHIAGTRHAGAIRDISMGGAGLRLERPVTVGTELTVEINADLHLTGIVVRRCAGGAGVRWTIPGSLAQHIDQAIQLGLGPAEW